MPHKNTKAFTLIELSIVLVIIGLIIAGVTAGRNLIASAQMRSTISDIGKIITAVNTFKLQYSSYPGDIKNFTSYFPTCTYPDWDGNACNGNGNGKIDSYLSGRTENMRVYYHLVSAGLYTGNFDGLYGGQYGGVTKNNTPFSPINGGDKLSYAFWRWNTGSSITQQGSVIMILGRPRLTADANQLKPYDSSTTATQMQAIDQKFDDSIAGQGNLIASDGLDKVHSCLNGSSYNTQYTNELNCTGNLLIKP